ncbi:MAG: hypothetical protein ABIQ53_09415 [Terracoccus sp.]
MRTVGPHATVPSAVLRVYLQQRRVARLCRARRLVRWLAMALVLVLVTMTVMRGLRVLGPPIVLVALLLAFGAWVVGVLNDYRVHSRRIDSRFCLARLASVRRLLAARERAQKVESAMARRAGADVVTIDQLELHAQARTLESEIDESEQRVERALIVGAAAAACVAVALSAAVAAIAVSLS